MDHLTQICGIAGWIITGTAAAVVYMGSELPGGSTSRDSTAFSAEPGSCSDAMYCVEGGTNPWLPYGTNPMVPWGSNPQIPGGPGHYSSGWDMAS
ncbi:Uncharacterised protein [Mycobacteroides abscessus]|uniref:Secreted protein n=1 Tax=Mycobacteroides abscessus subsp. abscessus TaxID=1185650 RepID=A0AB38D885_9MYCO|nr:hypothetical protein [Mycobacteroides abscessus]SHP26698.1 Uncharacterised protein [Mycobacteroides abscessus subsp. abscessus]MBE5453204.1 hypothetical protein [Mycobacteroides abscessus]MBE5495439.1 hypothetical protein [Mycobacteroides abscessus]CPR74859.1 Uncharacterised protein [Mycobacteroides abscessus]